MRNFRYQKTQRITKRTDYQALYKDGKRASTPLIRVHVLFKEPDNKPRLGIAVTRKVNSAAARNRLKRRVREIFRLHQWEIQPGTWMVVVIKPGAEALSYQDLESSLLGLWNRIRALKKPQTSHDV